MSSRMIRDKFEDLLGTNYIPTEEDVASIKQRISEPLARLVKLDEEIAVADARVQSLRQARADLLDGIEGYRRLISPVRRVPPDILREVFINCLPDDRNPTMSSDEAPVVLTRISSQWRTLALTTPRLWASLHIAVPNSSPVFVGSYDPQTGERLTLSEVTEVRLAATTEWIKKAGTLPLSFSIHEHDGYPPTDFCKKFIQCILPYRARWKSINLACVTASFLAIHDLPQAEVPMLQSLSLALTRTGSAGEETVWPNMPIFSAPVIRKISLGGIPTRISQFPFDWSQLTDLDIKGESWSTTAVTSLDEIVMTLTKCPNLISCNLHIGSEQGASQRTDFPGISLPHLETLTIFDGARPPALYAAINAPKLRKLTYTGGRPRRQLPALPTAYALYHLLGSVGSTLEELTANSSAFSGPDELLVGLAACPRLESLSIVMSHLVPPISNEDGPAAFIDRFLDSLAHVSSEEEYLCPKLEVFKCASDAFFSDEALVNFVTRKQSGEDRGLAPLKTVEVLFRRRGTIDVAALLSAHTAAGLELKLQYPPRTYRGPFSLFEGIPFTHESRDPYRQAY